jgi:transposase
MDAIRFKQNEHSREEIQEAKRRFERRLLKIAHGRYRDRDRRRIAKRLRKHLGSMFTFLEVEGLEPHNNAAERGLRESVVIRKISGGNRSEKGARTHEVMMSVMETYGLQGKDFFQDGMEYIQRQL